MIYEEYRPESSATVELHSDAPLTFLLKQCDDTYMQSYDEKIKQNNMNLVSSVQHRSFIMSADCQPQFSCFVIAAKSLR
jgi:hypothetical protein